MKIEKTVVFGFGPALRGMRNPMNSWDRSDTVFGATLEQLHLNNFLPVGAKVEFPEMALVGPNDLDLMLRLTKAGSEHRKFARQIMIWLDLTLPGSVWREFDTYHGDPESWLLSTQPVLNSCSTMHKLGSRDLTPDDFEKGIVDSLTLAKLNDLGCQYREAKKNHSSTSNLLLEEMKLRLPSGYLLKATYSMNYETAMNMYFQRRSHRLPQWSGPGGICEHIKTLPYMEILLNARSK